MPKLVWLRMKSVDMTLPCDNKKEEATLSDKTQCTGPPGTAWRTLGSRKVMLRPSKPITLHVVAVALAPVPAVALAYSHTARVSTESAAAGLLQPGCERRKGGEGVSACAAHLEETKGERVAKSSQDTHPARRGEARTAAAAAHCGSAAPWRSGGGEGVEMERRLRKVTGQGSYFSHELPCLQVKCCLLSPNSGYMVWPGQSSLF